MRIDSKKLPEEITIPVCLELFASRSVWVVEDYENREHSDPVVSNTVEVTFKLKPQAEVVTLKVKTIKNQISKLRAEFQKNLNKHEEEIQNLLALEGAP